MVWEWIIGALFRPGITFDRAQKEMRFGYWWILLSVFTLEIIPMLYSPALRQASAAPWPEVMFVLLVFLLLLVDLQALLLLGVARFFHWHLLWADAIKYTALSWSAFLAENMITFYPLLKGELELVLWLGLPFRFWHLIILGAGLRQISGFRPSKAFLIATLAIIPWQLGMFWLTWLHG